MNGVDGQKQGTGTKFPAENDSWFLGLAWRETWSQSPGFAVCGDQYRGRGVQLYLAIGIPSLLFALNFLAILWQARGLTLTFNTRIDSLEKVMMAKFEAQTQSLLRDVRLKHLEERER